eukprot:2966257-Rhodomonas_salina.2
MLPTTSQWRCRSATSTCPPLPTCLPTYLPAYLLLWANVPSACYALSAEYGLLSYAVWGADSLGLCRYGMIFLITKFGYLYVLDVETGTQVRRASYALSSTALGA